MRWICSPTRPRQRPFYRVQSPVRNHPLTLRSPRSHLVPLALPHAVSHPLLCWSDIAQLSRPPRWYVIVPRSTKFLFKPCSPAQHLMDAEIRFKSGSALSFDAEDVVCDHTAYGDRNDRQTGTGFIPPADSAESRTPPPGVARHGDRPRRHRRLLSSLYVQSRTSRFLTWNKVISAPIDYILWRPTLSHPSFPISSPLQLLWPELSALHYNLVQGEASNWGTSPWWYYLVNSLPRVCSASLPLAGVGLGRASVTRKSMRSERHWDAIKEVWMTFGLGVIVLVGAMSLVGHKVSEHERCETHDRNGDSSSISCRSSTSWLLSARRLCAY